MGNNNYYSISGTYGDAPKTIKVGFRSNYGDESVVEDNENQADAIEVGFIPNYDIEPALEANEHFFNVSESFPELAEYSRIDAGLELGLSPDSLTFSEDAIATIKMVQSAGIFKNVLGYYITDPDGTIRDVSVAFNNTRSAESGVAHSFQVDGNKGAVNFFLISNGYNLNRVFSRDDFKDGNLNFIYNKGGDDERPAKVTDGAEDITLIYQAGDGEITTVRGPIYHATEHGSYNNINGDGNTHVVSGLTSFGDKQAIRVGFEDFPGLGDADFNDVVFDVSASYLDPDYGDLDATLLSSIEPAAADQDDKDKDSDSLSDVDFGDSDKETNGSAHDDDGLSNPNSTNQHSGADPDFIVYLAEKMSVLLPDLYARVQQEILQQYGDAMHDNYELLFAEYVRVNYRHVYNEIKAGYRDGHADDNIVGGIVGGAPPEIPEDSTGDDTFFGGAPVVSGGWNGDFAGSYDDVIETIDHIDQSISNFINLNTIDDTIGAPVSSPVSPAAQPPGLGVDLQEGFEPVIEAEIII